MCINTRLDETRCYALWSSPGVHVQYIKNVYLFSFISSNGNYVVSAEDTPPLALPVACALSPTSPFTPPFVVEIAERSLVAREQEGFRYLICRHQGAPLHVGVFSFSFSSFFGLGGARTPRSMIPLNALKPLPQPQRFEAVAVCLRT